MEVDKSRPATPQAFSPADAERFLAIAVHELRSPASVMVTAAETLEQLLAGEDLPPDVREVVAMLARNGDHLGRLISDLLSSAFLEHGTLPLKTEPVPLRPLLGWAVDAAGGTNGDVVVDCDPLLHATVDPDRLEQVVTNLVVNALAHGTAPVNVTATPLEREPRAQVVIRDHGPGVPPADVPHLFERFSPLAVRQSQSTGLGLSVARGLARAMGGDLAYTAAHPGSRFVLTLMGA